MADDDSAAARLDARKATAAALAKLADAYESTRGGIVTGWVAVCEITTAEGKFATWITGSGAEPREDDLDGLTPWMVEGLARRVINEARNGATRDD